MESPAVLVSAIVVHNFQDKKSQTRKLMDKLHTALKWLTNVSTRRKTAKWKRALKQIQENLIVQRRRKECIVMYSRSDVAQLLNTDQLQIALYKVKQLYKDKCLLVAYDQIKEFCVCIASNLGVITSKKSALEDLSSDVSEAVSSIVFAASRCGELPELNLFRKLLRDRFGCRFEESNIKMCNENMVNQSLKKNLCVGSVSDEVKIELIKEIAEEYNLKPRFQDFKQIVGSEFEKDIQTSQQQALEKIGFSSCNRETNVDVQMKRLEACSVPKPVLEQQNCCSLQILEPRSQNESKELIKDLSSRKLKLFHVHPKLPEYDVVVAKLNKFRMEPSKTSR